MMIPVILAAGALVGCCFDLFRCLRRAYKKQPSWLVHGEDFIFLIIAAVLLVLAFCLVDFGRMRWYTVVLAILGAGVYFFGISPWLGKFLTLIFSIPGKIVKFFCEKILKK